MWKIIGHERVVEALRRSVEQGRVSHANLFTGPPMIGKATLAMNLAQALNCLGEERPCGECVQCRRIREAKHADVQVIRLGPGLDEDDDSHKAILTEQIEGLQQAAALQPFEGRAKVFIIEAAELMSAAAANRLLKTLEEPPATVYMVLLADDQRRLLPTVTSRCRVYELRPVPLETIETALTRDHGVDAPEARRLARLAEGRPGWALAAARDAAVLEDREEDLNEIVELVSQSDHQRLAVAARMANRFGRRRAEVGQWLGLLLQWWRDLLLVKGGRPEMAVNADRLGTLEETAAELSLQAIADALRRVEEAADHLERNVNPRLALEVLMLHLPVARQRQAALAQTG